MATVTSQVVATPVKSPGGAVGRRNRRRTVLLWSVVIAAFIYFLVPMLAMARFSLQNVPMTKLGASTLFKNWSFSNVARIWHDKGFWPSLWLSLRLAAGTIALTLGLMLPTALWAHLRAPRWRPIVELITVLPYVVPPIALVVGVIGAFRKAAPWFMSSPLCLIPFYTVLAMPFTYRSIDAGLRAIDLRTLTDASRSLGAGWWTTLRAVLVPNLRAALIGSTFLTTTVVLGEFTMASLLLKNTLPAFMQQFGSKEPQGGMALSLLVLLATSAMLTIISAVTRGKRARALAAGPV